MSKNVLLFMTKNPISVQMDAPLSVIKEIFEESKIHHVLVMENEILVGIVSDRDFLMATPPLKDDGVCNQSQINYLGKKSHQIMTRNPVSVLDSDDIFSAAFVMGENNISSLVVKNSIGKVVGILTWRDIIKAMGKLKPEK